MTKMPNEQLVLWRTLEEASLALELAVQAMRVTPLGEDGEKHKQALLRGATRRAQKVLKQMTNLREKSDD